MFAVLQSHLGGKNSLSYPTGLPFQAIKAVCKHCIPSAQEYGAFLCRECDTRNSFFYDYLKDLFVEIWALIGVFVLS